MAADAFPGSFAGDPAAFAAWALGRDLLLAVQCGLPYYLYARWRLRAPLAGLSGATVVVLFAFLQVRGETDPIGLYVFFAPLAVGAVSALALGEAGLGRLREPGV